VPRRFRAAGVAAIWVFVPTLFVLALAELGLRWHRRSSTEELITRDQQRWEASTRIHRKSEDDKLIYELVPGSEAVRNRVPIKINSAGFRDDEFPTDPTSRGRRIVLLGDSVAWGLGVLMEQAFPQVLESLLGESARGTTDSRPIVYNLAVDGYSTDQELRLLETKGLAYEPDLVILSYVLNDPDTQDGGLARYYTSRIELWERVREALYRVEELRSGDSVPDEYHQRIHARYRRQTREQFERLGQISAEHRVPILVAVVPVFRFKAAKPYAWRNLHQRIGALCEQNGLAFVDLYDESFRGSPSKRFAHNVWHPNAAGHSKIAHALHGYLEEASRSHGWVSPTVQ
jgi:lysophospholipase L1-like esterase